MQNNFYLNFGYSKEHNSKINIKLRTNILFEICSPNN